MIGYYSTQGKLLFLKVLFIHGRGSGY